VEGVIQAMLMPLPSMLPHYFARAYINRGSLQDIFDEQLIGFTKRWGVPSDETHPDWYPNAERLASWRVQDRTFYLVLEDDSRAGAAVLLWRLLDDELSRLKEAAATRKTRRCDPIFSEILDSQFRKVDEPGLEKNFDTEYCWMISRYFPMRNRSCSTS
jgi:hypothetical protein